MGQHTLFYRFGVALIIGILVGLQREHTYETTQKPDEKTAAGVRTFALMGLAGCTAALVADRLGDPWSFVGVVFALGILIALGYYHSAQRGEPGMTTEVAALVVIMAGALCFWDELEIAVALAVVTTALLSLKIELHSFAERITREDILATLKFAIITAIVLPVLPNQAIGPPPFDVLNPYKVWLMVVLISGISFLGYVLIQIVGSRKGLGLTGLLGGLASSTATTLSFAQRSHTSHTLGKQFALAIMLAWLVMFGRILVEVGAVYPPLLRVVWLPIGAAGVATLAFCAYLYLAPRTEEQGDVQLANPFELRPAITFGLLYGVILVASRAAELYFGNTGLYVSSILSGLADVDAITLTVAELSGQGTLDMETAARAIMLAAMANTAVKGGLVLSSGTRTLRRAFMPGFVLILVTGTAVAFLL